MHCMELAAAPRAQNSTQESCPPAQSYPSRPPHTHTLLPPLRARTQESRLPAFPTFPLLS